MKWLSAVFFLTIAVRESFASGQLPTPPYPIAAVKARTEGCVVISVKFGVDGKVESCRVLDSSGSPVLNNATVNFVKTNWVAKEFAGQTQRVPITYALPDEYSRAKVRDAVPMPNLLLAGEPERDVTVRVVFAMDGSIAAANVIHSSGQAAFDGRVTDWIKQHWHSRFKAGQTMDMPFDFKPPK